ncbi:MAG: aminotransferase class IV [Pirellulales bacterium]|nr:aminotransferase class IV [Pirellulales bacterium]
MSERVVYWNGRLVPEAEARLSIYDSALTMGDMAFEVTRTIRHAPYRLDDHLARLFHSLSCLQIDPGLSLGELRAATEATLARNLPTADPSVDWNIIHNVSRGPAAAFQEAFAPEDLRPTVLISCFPMFRKLAQLAPAYDTGIELVVPPQRALPHELLDLGIKTRSRLHYQLANLQAAERCAGSTPIMVDPDGFLTESTSGNVFIVERGVLLTPEPRNLLPGITRDTVLHLAATTDTPWREANITVAQAAAAAELFVTSTSIGVLHGRSFNGQRVGDGTIGPVTRRLRAALHAAVGLDFAEQAREYARRLESKTPD